MEAIFLSQVARTGTPCCATGVETGSGLSSATKAQCGVRNSVSTVQRRRQGVRISRRMFAVVLQYVTEETYTSSYQSRVPVHAVQKFWDAYSGIALQFISSQSHRAQCALSPSSDRLLTGGQERRLEYSISGSLMLRPTSLVGTLLQPATRARLGASFGSPTPWLSLREKTDL